MLLKFINLVNLSSKDDLDNLIDVAELSYWVIIHVYVAINLCQLGCYIIHNPNPECVKKWMLKYGIKMYITIPSNIRRILKSSISSNILRMRQFTEFCGHRLYLKNWKSYSDKIMNKYLVTFSHNANFFLVAHLRKPL